MAARVIVFQSQSIRTARAGNNRPRDLMFYFQALNSARNKIPSCWPILIAMCISYTR